jgi:hypothetical protein
MTRLAELIGNTCRVLVYAMTFNLCGKHLFIPALFSLHILFQCLCSDVYLVYFRGMFASWKTRGIRWQTSHLKFLH